MVKELDFIQQQWGSFKGSGYENSIVTLQLLKTSLCVSRLGATSLEVALVTGATAGGVLDLVYSSGHGEKGLNPDC